MPVSAFVSDRGRAKAEYLIQHPDGCPWDRGRVTTALRRAARAAGLPASTVDELTPQHAASLRAGIPRIPLAPGAGAPCGLDMRWAVSGRIWGRRG